MGREKTPDDDDDELDRTQVLNEPPEPELDPEDATHIDLDSSGG